MNRRRLLLTCGIAAPVLYAIADLLAGVLAWPEYSFRDQTISELGAIGAPTRGIFSALLVVTYALLTAFGIEVWRAAEGERRLRAAGACIVALGVLALTIGQFAAMRPRGEEQGLAGALHLYEGAVAMVLLFAAMGFAAAASGRRFRLYTVITVAMVVGFGGWSSSTIAAIGEGLETPWVGVIERVFWYSYQLWFAVFAVTLLRRRHGPTPPEVVSGVSLTVR